MWPVGRSGVAPASARSGRGSTWVVHARMAATQLWDPDGHNCAATTAGATHRRPLTIALVVFALALVIHGLADGGSSRSLRELLAKCVTEDRVGLRCGFPRAPMVGGQGRCPSSGRRRDGGDCVENGLTGRCGARTQWRDAAHRDGVARILRRRADPGQGPVRASHPHAAAGAPAGRADVGNL